MRKATFLGLGLVLTLACTDEGGATSTTSAGTSTGDGDGDMSGSESGEGTGDGDGDSTSGDGDGDPATGDGDGDATGDGDGDGDGDETGDGDGDGEQPCQPNPEICEPDVCDVITGECTSPDLPCVLAGPSTPCGDLECGPGTVCDDQGSCIPVAPCSGQVCEGDQCWGIGCACERPILCTTATAEDLNGPFATDIFDLDFADDCTAWMVTLRSGTDYVRRMTPMAELSEWAGVANLNMGEVAVLKALIPQDQPPPPPYESEVQSPTPPSLDDDDNLGEVAITYTCCPTCGCFVDPPQGVARLIEDAMVPLPIVLPAVATQGQNGPFNSNAGDAGPMGLTWGDDLQLYVGNSQQNGNFDTADLDAETQELLTSFVSRVTASAPVTSVHLLVALDTGEVLRFNTETLESTPVFDFEVGVTSLSHDSFSGLVYVSLSDLSIKTLNPFTAAVEDFEQMPALGRVAVSPQGQLWWVPAKFSIGNMPLSTWELPTTW